MVVGLPGYIDSRPNLVLGSTFYKKSCYSLIPIARCITEHFPQLCDLHQLLFVSPLHLWLSFQPLSAGKAFPGIVSSWTTACRWLRGFVGMGWGLGMMTFRALDSMLNATELLMFFRLAHMLDATELWGGDDDVPCTWQHVGCYGTAHVLSACKHVGCYTELFTWSHCISVYGDQTNELLREPCRLDDSPRTSNLKRASHSQIFAQSLVAPLVASKTTARFYHCPIGICFFRTQKVQAADPKWSMCLVS